MTGKFILNMIVVAGTAITGGNLFTAFVPKSQGIIFKGLAAAAGTTVGAYAGIRVANNLDEMINNAKQKIEEDEELEVRVNG